MSSEEELAAKRPLVGLLAVCGLSIGAVLSLFPGNEGVQATALRVGLLLGAFWLAMPTRNRAAAWSGLSRWSLPALVALGVVLPKLKLLIPIAGIVAVAWFLLKPRPAKRDSDDN